MPLPALPLLDDFNRPNESPLSDGGNWTSWGALTQCDLSGHRAVMHAVGVNTSRWVGSIFAADQVCGATIAAWNLGGGDGGEFDLQACSDAIGSAAYRLELDVASPSPTPNYLHLRRLDPVTPWLKVCTTVGIRSPVQAGDQIAINVSGRTIEAWYSFAGAWVLIDSADDSVLSGGAPALGAGYAAIGFNLGGTTGPAYSAAYGGVGGQLYRLPVLGAG